MPSCIDEKCRRIPLAVFRISNCSVQRRVFALRLFQHRQVRIGIFPLRQKILIRNVCLCRVAAECVSPRQPQSGERPARSIHHHAAIIADLLKRCRRFPCRTWSSAALRRERKLRTGKASACFAWLVAAQNSKKTRSRFHFVQSFVKFCRLFGLYIEEKLVLPGAAVDRAAFDF